MMLLTVSPRQSTRVGGEVVSSNPAPLKIRRLKRRSRHIADREEGTAAAAVAVAAMRKMAGKSVMVLRVEEGDEVGGLVEEDEETVGGAEVAVGGERREDDADGGRRREVEEAAARRQPPWWGWGDGEHRPVARAEAGVQASYARVGGALAPRPAHGAEADVLGDVDGEQPTGDLPDHFSKLAAVAMGQPAAEGNGGSE
uniref:Uncharacterized protein n=1 Tax=Oryza glumipatula TaxID=40148 RepID=A0A0E0ATA7_9ORYZ